jgi:cysteine-rich repeat protein
MKRILGSSLAVLLWAGSAGAQLTTTKYGLGHPGDFDFRKHPTNNRAVLAADIDGSYTYSRGNPASATAPDCGLERDFNLVLGQVLLTENHTCVPTSSGPRCVAGTSIGAVCHMPVLNALCTGAGAPFACCTGAGLGNCQGNEQCTGAGAPHACCTGAGAGSCPPYVMSQANTVQCGTGGRCEIEPGVSCPVEIPKTTDLTPLGDRSDVYGAIINKNPTIGLQLLSSSSFALGGSADGTNPQCLAQNVRPVTTKGRRYRLPASRGGTGAQTFIRWNEDPRGGSSMYRYISQGKLCCNSVSNTLCAISGSFQPAGIPWPEYETGLLFEIGCQTPGDSVIQFVWTPDWVFTGGPASNFRTDPDFIMPGMRVGACRVNRDRGCATLPQPPFPTQTNCATLDADPNTPGLQPDTCDFREDGIRSSRPAPIVATGYPNTEFCASSLYVLKGTAGANCFLIDGYDVDGDPGPNCDVNNIGGRTRADMNCDGVVDAIPIAGLAPGVTDLCPLLNENDPFRDSDGDCQISAARCRGDECECGDHSLNGIVTVADIVSINGAIFSNVIFPICDTNLDARCNVSDIVGANREIFLPGSSVCHHLTTLDCGDGFLDPATEECDDGNRFSGDGCNAICRDE